MSRTVQSVIPAKAGIHAAVVVRAGMPVALRRPLEVARLRWPPTSPPSVGFHPIAPAEGSAGVTDRHAVSEAPTR